MFAGAAFTDQADISQTEAVDMLTALGVIEGFPDGSFAPDATITRAQAAKMIYTIWNGGNADASAFEGKSVFTDVYSGHWAEGYINFCYTNGIINGLSATKFGPDDSVTGTQLAKMLLICMGYQADKSGLEGTGYSQRTNALATQNGLYVDVATSVSQAMPRQFAAQLMYNALKADTVVWSSDRNTYEKVATTSYRLEDTSSGQIMVPVTVYETMGKKCMDLNTIEVARLTKVEKEANRDTYSLNDGRFTRVANDYSNLIGQRVNVLQKGNDSSKVYGVYAHEDSTVVATGFVGQLENGTVGDAKIKLAGTEYDLDENDNAMSVYSVNDDATVRTTLAALTSSISASSHAANTVAQPIKLIDNNGDGDVDFAVYTPVAIGEVTSVTNTSVTVNNGGGTKKFADDTIYEGVAKNDYARVIDKKYVSEGGSHVEKLDVVNAKVEGLRTGAPNEARVDGTWYKLANGVSVDTNTTYDLVIIGNYILFAEETEGSVANVAFISGVKTTPDQIVGDNNVSVKVRMYFNDGTNAEVSVSKLNGTNLTSSRGGVGIADVRRLETKMVTYTKLSDGTYDIEAVGGGNLAGCDTYAPDAKGLNASAYHDSKINGVSIADDAVIFVKTGYTAGSPLTSNSETKVLTGAQVKDWGTDIMNAGSVVPFDGTYLAEEANGINYIQAATLVTNVDMSVPGSSDLAYAYAVVNEYDGVNEAGETKAAVDVWNGSSTVTLYADASNLMSIGSVQAGDLIAYSVNGDYIEDVTVAQHEAAVLGFDGKAEGELRVLDFVGGSAVAGGDTTYTLAEDCVILVVDDLANAGVEGASLDSIQEAGYDSTGTNRIPNVRYILGSDIGDSDNANKVVAIVIDESNELA